MAAVYGDFRDPADPGSGGGTDGNGTFGGTGGGLVRITAQTVQLDGPLVADGAPGGGGCCAGGGIKLIVTTLRGTGSLRATGDGGDARRGLPDLGRQQ